jgi:hypothetical protein
MTQVRYSAGLRSVRKGEGVLASGYCVKCKATREIKDAKQITMKNGRPATQGICPVCGTKIFKIGAPGKAEQPAAATASEPAPQAAPPSGPSYAAAGAEDERSGG